MTIEDMQLTEKEQTNIAEDKVLYGADYAVRRTRWLKVRLYREQFLSWTEVSRARPYNCYYEGTDRYRRKDGQPLTAEDIRAIYESSSGQGSQVHGKAGDKEVDHEWFIDSSD